MIQIISVLLFALPFFSIAACSLSSRPVNFLNELPDDLFVSVALEYVIHDVPAFTPASRSILSRVIIHSVFQSYLARKFSFPPLRSLPFKKNLQKLVFPYKLHYGEILYPKDLFFVMDIGHDFETVTSFEKIILLLFDHFSLAPSHVEISCPRFGQFVLNVVVSNRSLFAYLKSRTWLAFFCCRFEDVPEIQRLLSTWFVEEHETFKEVFFSGHFVWNARLLVSFCKAPGTKLSPDLLPSQCGSFLSVLRGLFNEPKFNVSDIEAPIFETCQEHIKLNKSDDKYFTCAFNARFNSRFEFLEPVTDENKDFCLKIAIAIAFSRRFDEAIRILWQIKRFGAFPLDNCCFLERFDFVVYVIEKDVELARWLFKQLPDQFYMEPEFIDTVKQFYGPFLEYFESNASIDFHHRINLVFFTVCFDTSESFELCLQKTKIRTDLALLHKIEKFRQNTPEYNEFVQIHHRYQHVSCQADY